MPGFRKGMVPMSLVKKMYGKSVIAEEVNKVLQEAVYNYIKENKVNMLGEPLPNEEKQQVIDFDTMEEFEFVFDIALAPEFKAEVSAKDKVDYYTIEVSDEMIENQVYLAQGAYVRVVGYSAELLPVCEAMHYALVALHLRIQTAVAYEKLGKSEEAHAWLRKALSDAEPDGLVMPFVENYDILKPLLEREVKNDLLSKIIELGEAATARNAAGTRPAAFDVLTPREFEIVELMAQRLSNREIAEQLFLSEGSVKQYVNQIYSKLHIEGDTRTKRKLLAELLR